MKLAILGIVLAGFLLLGCQPAEEGGDDGALAGEAVRRTPVTLDKLWNAEVLVRSADGVNCNTVCLNSGSNNRKTCIAGYIGIEHDIAQVGEVEEIVTEWVPVDCFAESEINPMRCRCY